MIIEISADFKTLTTETKIIKEGYPDEPFIFGYCNSIDQLYESIVDTVNLIFTAEDLK